MTRHMMTGTPPDGFAGHFYFCSTAVKRIYNPKPTSVSQNLYFYPMTDLRMTPQGRMSKAMPGQTEIQRLTELKKMKKREDKISMMTDAMSRKEMMDEFKLRYK